MTAPWIILINTALEDHTVPADVLAGDPQAELVNQAKVLRSEEAKVGLNTSRSSRWAV